jgi:hypothetical protein
MISISNMKLGLVVGLVSAATSFGCDRTTTTRSAPFESQVQNESTDKQATPKEAFTIQSNAFTDGAELGRQYTRDGDNRLPELSWKGVPTGTKSLALEVTDPDARTGTFTHLLAWNIPLKDRRVDVDAGVKGKNDAGKLGWSGPEPPAGSGPHHYVFRLYALDLPSLKLDEGATRADLDAAVKGHVLGATEITGLYGK